MPSATVTRSKPSARAPTQNADRAEGAAPQIGHDDRPMRASRSQVRNSRTADSGGEVVRHLAQRARRPPTWRGRAARPRSRRRTAPRPLREPGRHRAQLEPERRGGGCRAAPAQRAASARQVAEAGAEIEQGERRARGHALAAPGPARSAPPRRRRTSGWTARCCGGTAATVAGSAAGSSSSSVPTGLSASGSRRSRQRGVAAAVVQQRMAVAASPPTTRPSTMVWSPPG